MEAVAGSLLLNYYFTPPIHLFNIAEGNNVLALVIFVAVGLTVSSIVDSAARRSKQAARASAESELLVTTAGSVLRGQQALAAVLSRVRHLARPHSHEPSDRVDRAMEGSAAGMRVLWISLAVLGVTALVQAVITVASGSVALLGDTLHNAADALTAVPLGIAFLAARRPASRRYTYGYGRAEDLAGVLIVAVIAASAVLAAVEAISRLLHPRPVSGLIAVGKDVDGLTVGSAGRLALGMPGLRPCTPTGIMLLLEEAGTVLEGAELVLTDVPAQGRCRACGAESVLHDFPLACAACGGFDLELLRGEELLVDALELEEEALTAKGGTVHGD